MFENTYVIGDTTLNIYCEVLDYVDLINKRMSMFNIDDSCSENYLKIYKTKTIYKINDKYMEIPGKLIKTDLYPLLSNIVSNLINDEYNIFMHSCVLCYNDVGILIIGDFGQGKTSLCLEALKNNIDVLSSDQTHLIFNDDKLLLENGSKYMRIRNGVSQNLLYNDKKIEIKYILNLIGLCDGGNIKFELINNEYHKIKILFQRCTQHSNIPLFTDDNLLSINRIYIKEFLSKVTYIPFINVRGDIKNIIEKIKENLND